MKRDEQRRAETLFAEYLARVEAGDPPDFESWVSGCPKREQHELLRFHDDWRKLRGVRRYAGLADGSFFSREGERGREPATSGREVGQIVGEFRLVSLIAQGGMGQVWEAEQTTLGDRRVALKFVRPDRLTPRQLELFEREARAGGRLNHSGIVGVHGYGREKDLSWIAMELVAGCWTLRDFLDEMDQKEELPADYDRHVGRFVAEVAEAMQVAHDAGVIHRDLKPQNILITKDDHPKITDFGLARITDETALSQTGEFTGTYFYMSPEQVAARRMGIDHRTDVFSLGVMLYEMLALRRPFQGDTTHQVAEQIVTKDPPDLRSVRSRISRDLCVIAGKAMEKDRDRRYSSMAELALDLRRHLEGETIRARPASGLRRGMTWLHRNRTRAAIGALSILIVLIGAFVSGTVLFLHAMENRLIAPIGMAHGSFLSEAQVTELRKLGILEPGEPVELFYNIAFWSIGDEGQLLTPRRVVSYQTIDGRLQIESALWTEIAQMADTSPADDDRRISIAVFEDKGVFQGSEFEVSVPTENGSDRLWIEAMQRLWDPWTPHAAVGAPDAAAGLDDPRAWAPLKAEMGRQWIELTYDPPLRAERVIVHEANTAGFVEQLLGFDPNGGVRELWRGQDPLGVPGPFDVELEPSTALIERVRIVIDTDRTPGWEEIDAVELVGPEERAWAVSATASSHFVFAGTILDRAAQASSR